MATIESGIIMNYSPCFSLGQCFGAILSPELSVGLAELEFSLCPILPSIFLVNVVPQSLP